MFAIVPAAGLAQPSEGAPTQASESPPGLAKQPLLRSDPPQPPQGKCPPGGYAKPVYGAFIMNDFLGASYELASPCVSAELRDAAEAIGMGRGRPLGLKNVLTVMFTAEGRIADLPGRTKVDMHVNYGQPAARLFITPAAGPRRIEVFNRDLAWNEESEGGRATPTPGVADDRAAFIRLTPFGALWTLIEAEGHAKVTKRGGRTVISGRSPYDGVEATVTLNGEGRPVAATIRSKGQTYEATFADYWDEWEPAYLVIFPKKITWRKNARPYADLTVTAFKSNPYVVFPVPGNVGK
jgi:hypothetical protein